MAGSFILYLFPAYLHLDTELVLNTMSLNIARQPLEAIDQRKDF